MSNLFFYIQYYIYIYMLKLFKKRREYVFILLNTYPNNLSVAFKLILDTQTKLKYMVLPNSVVLFFDTKKKLDEIHTIFRETLGSQQEEFDMYMLFYVKPKNNQLLINTILYDRFLKSNAKGIDDALNNIEMYFRIMRKLKDNINQMLGDEKSELPTLEYMEKAMNNISNTDEITNTNETISIDYINEILERISRVGYDNLTDKEKTTLKKYTSNE